jgi:hypothetical protein
MLDGTTDLSNKVVFDHTQDRNASRMGRESALAVLHQRRDGLQEQSPLLRCLHRKVFVGILKPNHLQIQQKAQFHTSACATGIITMQSE